MDRRRTVKNDTEIDPVFCLFVCREVLSNGSLHFPAFSGEMYSSEVHTATYRCAASNLAGTILSREMRVRAGEYRQAAPSRDA